MQVREAAPSSRAVEHRFYLVTTLAMLLAVAIGFSRSFFLRPLFPGWPSPSEPVFYVHGLLFAAWCVFLVGQAALVSGGRTPLHRTLGWYGAGLAAAMVATGTYAALVAANRPTGFTGMPVPPLQFLAVPAFDILLFPAFVALAVVKRRDAQAHKRLMLLASVNLVAAAFARWPVVHATLPLLRSRRPVHRCHGHPRLEDARPPPPCGALGWPGDHRVAAASPGPFGNTGLAGLCVMGDRTREVAGRNTGRADRRGRCVSTANCPDSTFYAASHDVRPHDVRLHTMCGPTSSDARFDGRATHTEYDGRADPPPRATLCRSNTIEHGLRPSDGGVCPAGSMRVGRSVAIATRQGGRQ
jgi:hypothetical protein